MCIDNKETMPFQAKFTEDELLTYFKQFGSDISAENVKSAAAHLGVKVQSVTKRMNKISRLQKVGRGKWCLTANEILKAYEAPAATKPAPETRSYVPSKNAEFVPFGNYSPLKKIIQSKMFYPAFITGLSGNGKTLSVEQACATLNRELIRVNITIETDEDDLLGGFRLVNGDTVWHNGPVIEALERGAILLLDEIDLASNKILCLQSILEGNGVFLKKMMADTLDPPQDSTSSQPQILRVKVQTTEDLLELTCSTKHSLSDSLSPSSKTTPLPQQKQES